MTVKEIIEKLQQYPAGHEIVISDLDNVYTIDQIYESMEPEYDENGKWLGNEISQNEVAIIIK